MNKMKWCRPVVPATWNAEDHLKSEIQGSWAANTDFPISISVPFSNG